MNLIHSRALLCEPVSLVRERACQMLEQAGYAPCAVSELDLFHDLRAKLAFDLYLFGVRSLDRVAQARLEREPRPDVSEFRVAE